MKVSIVMALAGATIFTVSVIGTLTKSAQNEQEVTALRASVAEAEADVEGSKALLGTAVAELASLVSEHDARQAVLDERGAFVKAVSAADAALTSAKDKLDVAGQREKVLAAQQAVLAERSDPEVVASQAAVVADLAAKITAEVKAHDERVASEAKARAAATNSSSSAGSQSAAPNRGGGGGGNWFADMRQRLNAVGGGHVALSEYNGQCGGGFAVACSVAGGGIKVHPDIAGWSSSRKNWAMSHELAHQVHFQHWSAVGDSAGYRQLFGSNPELLANCMASARGYTDHGHSCSGEMVGWAGGLWSGRIAW